MDLFKLIKDLKHERDQVDLAIRALESVNPDGTPVTTAGKRGRKYMDPEERKVVSERMRRYWAERKAKAAGSEPTS